MAEKNGIGEKVELGFAEECEDPDDFSSDNFPSKTGGKPVWLDPVSLPPLDSLTCKECKKPSLLLLQVYAPHSDDPANFHRTIYIFMCTDPKCCKPGSSKSFRVLRCQLPKHNPYYDDEVDDNDRSNTEGILRLLIICVYCNYHKLYMQSELEITAGQWPFSEQQLT